MTVELNKYNGVVVASKANYLYVEINLDEEKGYICLNNNSNHIRLLCTRRNKLQFIGDRVNVGDNVLVENIDLNEKTGVVCGVKSRKSFIARPPVANVTNIVVLLSLVEPYFDFDQANRFLITAEKTNLEVSLVLTKSDLISKSKIKEYVKQIINWGYEPFIISIKNEEGIDELISKIETFKLAVLCGPSGVGKTSLINFLLPNKYLTTSSVSKKLKRGKHTTRNVELFALNAGCLIADTPGFNRPDLEIDPFQLAFLFPELRKQIQNKETSCKFRNCLHRDEPGCSIDKNWQRYSFYRECLDEMITLHRQVQEG